jgi:hypothetical protein
VANDGAVKYACGFVENFIEKAMAAGVENSEEAITYLRIIEVAFDEYRVSRSAILDVVQEIVEKLNVARFL